jgi:geranylgeranyl diphosphate synthase type II
MSAPEAGGCAAAFEERRRAVEDALDRALPAAADWPETIHEAVRYSLFAGGKRIRPQLALAAAEAAGGRWEDALPYACAVEMIHTYSLVHDDLPAMDDDDLRRGRPTSHKVYGEAIAILAGDALLTRAFHLLAEGGHGEAADRLQRRLRAIEILGAAAGTTGLIGGQVADLESEGRAISAGALQRMHSAKTGALLGASVRGAAVLAGATPEDERALVAYGHAVGLAFQIVDDVLDATADSTALGKTAGKDARAGKATYVREFGIEKARGMAKELLRTAHAAVRPLGARARALEELATLVVERAA